MLFFDMIDQIEIFADSVDDGTS